MTIATEQAAYARAMFAAGLPRDQADRFMRAGYVALPNMLPFHRVARQIDDRRHHIREILLDGTRGSAKSHAVIAQVGIDDCQRCAGGKWLFLRKTERAAAESFEDLVARVLHGVQHKANSERIEFVNGSRILIGGYKDASDIEKYIGIEYDGGLVVEEVTQLSGDRLEMLFGSVRTSRPDWVPRVYLTTNPGGVGHQFIKNRFVIPNREGRETFTRRFFSSYRDNPFINVEYKEYLESLTGDLARAWRDGDWDVFAGQAFPEWRHDLHVVKPFEIPTHWTRKTGFDWGYHAPACCLWAARNPDNGRWVIYRELYQAGLTDPRQAETILQLEDAQNETPAIVRRFADPSMWAKKTQGADPTSSADIFKLHGLTLTPASNDRLAGKRKIDALLAPLADGQPGVLVFETAVNFIRTFPQLIYDETHVEDVDTDGEDHAYDALRYLLTDDVAQQEAKKPKRIWTPPAYAGKGF